MYYSGNNSKIVSAREGIKQLEAIILDLITTPDELLIASNKNVYFATRNSVGTLNKMITEALASIHHFLHHEGIINFWPIFARGLCVNIGGLTSMLILVCMAYKFISTFDRVLGLYYSFDQSTCEALVKKCEFVEQKINHDYYEDASENGLDEDHYDFGVLNENGLDFEDDADEFVLKATRKK